LPLFLYIFLTTFVSYEFEILKLKKNYFILSLIGLIGTIIFALSYFEISQSRKEIRSIAENEIKSILKTSKYSIENNLKSNRYFEEEIIRRLASSAALLSHLPKHYKISSDYLNEYCDSYELDIALIFENQSILSNDSSLNYRDIPINLIDNINYIKDEKFMWLELGINKIKSKDYYLVGGLFENDNKIFVVGVLSDKLLEIRRSIGIGKLLEDFRANSDVAYALLQDTFGILSASKNFNETIELSQDSFLVQTLMDGKIKTRIISVDNQTLMEGIIKVENDDSDFIFRLFMELDTIKRINQRDAFRTILLSSGLFLLSIIAIVLIQKRLRHNEELKVIKERNERLESLGVLAASIAHEIRNPMNAISMIAQRFKLEFEPKSYEDEYYNLSDVLINEVKRINKIITEFLEFASIKKSILTKNSLNKLVKRVTDVLINLANDKNVKIENNLKNEIEFSFDFDKLEQVLINILQNSIDSIENNGIVKIEYFWKDKKNIIKISDNGPGISPEIQDKIFNLYFTTKKKGSGLGLAISYKIINEHNGLIYFNSNDKGTEFYIELPD